MALKDDATNDGSIAVSRNISLLFFLTAMAITVLIQMPTTALGSVPTAVRTFGTILYPQGWQFFTKNPDDMEMTAYRVVENVARPATDFPNARYSNLLGFRRAQRAQGTEMASLGMSVRNWTDCTANYETCLSRALKGVESRKVANPSDIPTLCGLIVLVQTAPVPWEYRTYYEGYRLDKKMAALEVSCG